MVSGFDLNGRVNLNAAPAINTARKLAGEFTELSAQGKVGSAEMTKLAQTFKTVGAAANAERASIARLATAQATLNKELAASNLLQQKANAIRRDSIASSGLTRAKAGAVTSGAADATLVAEGRAALAAQRGLTEEVRRTTLANDAQGRAAVRAAQISSIAARDQIAAQRLLLSQQRAATAATTIGAERAATALGHVGSSLATIGTYGAGAFIGIIANAVIMEKQFAAVVRTSDLAEKSFASVGDKADAIKTLRGQFDALAAELPVSYKELTEIGAAANQLGIQTSQLAGFTKAVAQFSATTGVSVDTASTAFGRLNSLVTDVVVNGQKIGEGVNGDFQALADSINKVGVNSVATDQQIINIAGQIAGIANAAGLGYKEIVGFSGALASVAVSPYLARGATTRLFTNINNAVAQGGESLEKFAKVSGVSAQQFAQAWSSSPDKALVQLFDGINKSGANAVNVMADLGIKSVLDQPALLRVAKLADSAGNAGEGLAQSFRDAADAAGTNQEQYEIIANTVQGRLQVALNRVQLLFRNIADSNLGPLGNAISDISAGVLHLSQTLDKPAKLLGQFTLPFTNGDLLGTTVALTGIAGAFALGLSLIAKFGASLLRLRTALTFVGSKLGLQARETTALGTASGTAATQINALAAAQERQAAAARLAAGASVAPRQAPIKQTNAAGVVGASPTLARLNSNSQLASRYAAGVDSALVSNNKLIRSMGVLGATGASAAGRVGGALRSLGGAARTAGGAVSSLVGGPAGLAVLGGTALVAGIGAAVENMKSIGTTAGDAALGIVRAKTAMEQLRAVSISTQDPVGAIFDRSTVSADKLFGSTERLGNSLENLGSGGVLNDFAAKFTQASDSTAGFNSTTAALEKLDAGFQNITDSGNLDGAVKGIQELFKGQSDTAVVNGLAHMSNATGILRLALQQAGVSAGDNDENLLKLVRSSSILGEAQAKAAQKADALSKAFNNDTAAAQNFSEAQGALVVQATDLNKAYSDAAQKSGGGKASFSAFIEQAKKNYQDFVNAQRNALKIAVDTGADFNDLSKLPADILAEAAKNKLNENSLVDAMGLKDAGDGLETGIAAIINNPKLAALYASLGTDAQKKITDALSKGTNIDDAFAGLGPKINAAYEKAIAGTALAPPKTGPSKAQTLAITALMKITADPRAAYKAGEDAKQYIDGIKATLTATADTLPATKAGESASDYIKRIPTVMQLLGDNAPAIQKGESAKEYIDRLKGTLTATADNLPAIRKGETAAQYIDRLAASINVTANTAAAEAAINQVARARTVPLYYKATPVGSGNGGFLKQARGGQVRGPGTETSDSIPTLLSNKEFVVRAAVAKKNLGLLTDLNNGRIRGYANGGQVTSAGYEGTYVSRQSATNSRGPAITVTELSAYDRHLLVSIQEAVGITIDAGTVSRATSSGNTRQSRRGNG